MDVTNDKNAPSDNAPLAPLAPLSPVDAHRAETEARQRAAMNEKDFLYPRRSLGVEAEARRISEEVTREAQERSRAAQALVANAPSVEANVAHGEPVASAPVLPLPTPVLIKHIVVPLDGTAFAERALPYATAIAHIADARLVLAHVVPPSGALDTLIAESASQHGHGQTKDMRAYLESLRQSTPLERQRIGVAVRQAGAPAQGIHQLEEQGLVDLVVMATHAREGLERALMGSMADELLRNSHAPLLVVSPRVTVPRDGTPLIAHAVVPLDGTLLSEQALGALGGLLAATPDAEHGLREVTLLTVVEHRALVPDGESYLAALRRLLELRYADAGLIIHTLTEVGDPATIITSIASRQSAYAHLTLTADLLIMATHGRGGVGRWLLGSVASTVLPRTPLPVMLVHPAITER